MLSFYSSSTNGIKNTYRVENGANLAERFHSQSGFFIVQFSICPVFFRYQDVNVTTNSVRLILFCKDQSLNFRPMFLDQWFSRCLQLVAVLL